MRKLLLTTAAVAAAIGVAGCGSGTFTDNRDGQKYRTVIMPDGKTWMAQNLNYETDSSWCYKDSLSYCKKYGRLYNWKTAKTVCPKGWKLPSNQEWDRLVATAGGEKMAGKKLKAKSGWKRNDYDGVSGNGTDSFGFSALPGGYRYSDGDFNDAGYYGNWWTATENASDYAYRRNMDYDDDLVYEYGNRKSNGYSVRCVADRP
jgi:uncharacterized protein (TIGR02145 family)